MTLVDRWIIARFHRAVAEANDALKAYRFDVYAKACYDFFWRDFCDWYVEAIKPAMKDPARAPQTASVLAARPRRLASAHASHDPLHHRNRLVAVE